MSDKILSGAALAAAGVAAAGLLSARSAQAATPTTHVTLYFSAPPATAGAVAANTIQIPNTSPNFSTPPLDVQILNFALFVETLEAERYRQTIALLTTGGTDQFGNPITGMGLSPNTTNNLDVLLTIGFAATEMQQRDIIATTLYGAPNLNPFLSTSTNSLGILYDFGIQNQTRLQAVSNISVAETIGVAAYLGGSGLLSIKSKFLAPSAAFLGVEARHAAGIAYAVNALAGSPVFQTAPLAKDVNTLLNGGHIPGADNPLTADAILYQGGQVATGLAPVTNGSIPVLTGPTGFAYRAS